MFRFGPVLVDATRRLIKRARIREITCNAGCGRAGVGGQGSGPSITVCQHQELSGRHTPTSSAPIPLYAFKTAQDHSIDLGNPLTEQNQQRLRRSKTTRKDVLQPPHLRVLRRLNTPPSLHLPAGRSNPMSQERALRPSPPPSSSPPSHFLLTTSSSTSQPAPTSTPTFP